MESFLNDIIQADQSCCPLWKNYKLYQLHFRPTVSNTRCEGMSSQVSFIYIRQNHKCASKGFTICTAYDTLCLLFLWHVLRSICSLKPRYGYLGVLKCELCSQSKAVTMFLATVEVNLCWHSWADLHMCSSHVHSCNTFAKSQLLTTGNMKLVTKAFE